MSLSTFAYEGESPFLMAVSSGRGCETPSPNGRTPLPSREGRSVCCARGGANRVTAERDGCYPVRWRGAYDQTMKSTRVTVATTATQIRKLKAGGACMIRVPTGGADVYLGGADVTTSNGFLVAATESVPWSATAAETIYGIVAASTQVVHVLTAGEYD